MAGPIYRPLVRSLENRIDSVSIDDLHGVLLSEEASFEAESVFTSKEPIVPNAHAVQGPVSLFIDDHF